MNRQDFERVAMPHLDSVFRLARQFVRSDEDAGGLVQETYLRARRMTDRFKPRSVGVASWLFSILHTVMEDHLDSHSPFRALLRDESSPIAIESDDPGHAHHPDDEPAHSWSSDDERLAQAIRQLRPEYRGLLLLWGVERLSCSEIAHVLGRPIETIQHRLNQVRTYLEAYLSRDADRFVMCMNDPVLTWNRRPA